MGKLISTYERNFFERFIFLMHNRGFFDKKMSRVLHFNQFSITNRLFSEQEGNSKRSFFCF